MSFDHSLCGYDSPWRQLSMAIKVIGSGVFMSKFKSCFYHLLALMTLNKLLDLCALVFSSVK